MRRLFIQFYLLLIGCFTLAILLVGVVYQVTAERAGDRYLERMMQGSLGLLTGELARTPPERWPDRLAEQSSQFTLPLKIGELVRQPLASEDQAFLAAGNIVIVEEDDTFLQRIPDTDRVLIVGPVPYLSYLHELHWVDVGLLLVIGLSLGLPILLWLRPHWRGLQQLEQTARRVGDGDLSCRTNLPQGSSLARVGRTFDQMATQLQAMIASRKQLTDAIAHELRTPLVRLRYRLAMLEPAPAEQEQQALERDLGALDSLIEEMLTYARLDRPELPLQQDELELSHWAQVHLGDWQALAPEKKLTLDLPPRHMPWCGDQRLLTRAVENLIGNALRYAESEVTLSISRLQENYLLEVSDDGLGIDPALTPQIFEPFVRLDQSRDRRTGGTGLGLAIVRSIARHHGGDVALLASDHGARFCLTLPVHLDTNRHQPLTEGPPQPS
ncbi:two-component system sensor histidine kinase RstB [Aeromonas veronii]|uniref:two-component system sensor histidine kinase RstB n=1 Tax=Aeromonas veronii TaxID=654 RepID=UPI001FD0AC37|nr:two-component system sensor histidine kinase RstB [Aeromonas veronii]MCJ7976084.1 two-component system sensor histidine kinase RstB [Aeromonas veronii]UOR20744.1 two-component system sensor histidine kinase RstB [Aeromonas veronii]